MSEATYFKLCSTCKRPIAYGSKYYKCSVSTCNKKVTALYFCTVPCWDAHVPDARHRDAWAEVETAPSHAHTADEQAVSSAQFGATATALPTATTVPSQRRVVSSRSPQEPSSVTDEVEVESSHDVLIVMSKLKGYIKTASELRTSDGVCEPLSNHLRELCRAAIKSANANQRGTVLARDFEAVLRGTVAKD